jgi:hypothetical protein
MLMASVSCAGICTITPDDGNVAIPDPENFSLEVDWSPQHLALIEPDDDRGEWLFRLIFQITGGEPINSGGMGAIDLIDTSGVPIAELNVGIDDLSGAPITVNYEIFGPDTGSSFVARGFTLAIDQRVREVLSAAVRLNQRPAIHSLQRASQAA